MRHTGRRAPGCCKRNRTQALRVAFIPALACVSIATDQVTIITADEAAIIEA
jgi:hypothetical protein